MSLRQLLAVGCLGALITSGDLRAGDLTSQLDLLPDFQASGLFSQTPAVTPTTAVPDFELKAQSDDSGSSDSGRSREDGPKNYFGAKAGAFWGTGDLHDADEVLYLEAVFGRYIIGQLLSIEANVGFAYDDEDVGPVDVEIYAIPAFINARLSIPVLFLEPYIGAGVGGFYLHGEVDGPGFDSKDDDVVVAGDIFAGLNVDLGNRLYISGEVKYYVTDKTDVGFDLDGFAVTAGLGFRF